MAIEVFNRYEKKYMLSEKQYTKMISKIGDYMELDEYNKTHEFYSISNIYYDTADDRLIRNSIEKPVYKEKLRVRAYGVPTLEDKVYVEIKKKFDGIVNKRRTGMTLKEAYDYLDNNVIPDLSQTVINKQVFREIDYFKNFYELVPKVLVSYDRRAYFEIDDGDFRLTFDTNVKSRRENVRLEIGDYGEKLLPDDVFLMEVKILNAAPVWFSKILSELGIRPGSFSKYGTDYKNYVRRMCYEKENEKCLNQFLQQQQRARFQLAHQC